MSLPTVLENIIYDYELQMKVHTRHKKVMTELENKRDENIYLSETYTNKYMTAINHLEVIEKLLYLRGFYINMYYVKHLFKKDYEKEPGYIRALGMVQSREMRDVIISNRLGARLASALDAWFILDYEEQWEEIMNDYDMDYETSYDSEWSGDSSSCSDWDEDMF